MYRVMDFLNLGNEYKNSIIKTKNKVENFSKLKTEFNKIQTDTNEKRDDYTDLNFNNIDIGLKNFDTKITMLKCERLKKISDDKEILLLKFKRTKDKNNMSLQEIEDYIEIVDGEVKFKKQVSPELIYKIAKTLNNEFYFIVNCHDNVIPISKFQAKQIFKDGCNIILNNNLHVKNVIDEVSGKIIKPSDISDIFINWFNNNVNHPHPYGYSDMVISEQIKHCKHIKKDEHGRLLTVKAQFSNELTDKYLTEDNVYKLKSFVMKCQKMYNMAKNLNEEHIFALPFPLYSKEHMLSVVLCFKPSGDINITIVNANGLKAAKQEYAIPISNIIQKAFEKYSKILPEKTSYFFHENHSQYGGTCMTHADCITKQLIKDPEFEKDGHDLHPIKIWEKAYIRGFATTLYQTAIKQGKFTPDNIQEVKQEHILINNTSDINKLSRNTVVKCEDNMYNQKYKCNNTYTNISKKDRNNFINIQCNSNNNLYNNNCNEKQTNCKILQDKNNYFFQDLNNLT